MSESDEHKATPEDEFDQPFVPPNPHSGKIDIPSNGLKNAIPVKSRDKNTTPNVKDENQFNDDQSRSEGEIEALKAKTRGENARAADQEALTKLKTNLATSVLGFMFNWSLLIGLGVGIYFYHQVHSDKEIPKEIILGMFTATTVVIGLVGFILKGLFGTSSKQ
jgi:hypothetical protein